MRKLGTRLMCVTFMLVVLLKGVKNGTYRVAAAFTQFAGGSTKYFGTQFLKPKRDPA